MISDHNMYLLKLAFVRALHRQETGGHEFWHQDRANDLWESEKTYNIDGPINLEDALREVIDEYRRQSVPSTD